MTAQTLIAVDPDALEAVARELKRINDRLDAVEMQPRPDWLTVPQYAEMIGRSKDTVNRRIRAGRLAVKDMGGTRMVKVNQDV